jgi:hypothetical protein
MLESLRIRSNDLGASQTVLSAASEREVRIITSPTAARFQKPVLSTPLPKTPLVAPRRRTRRGSWKRKTARSATAGKRPAIFADDMRVHEATGGGQRTRSANDQVMCGRGRAAISDSSTHQREAIGGVQFHRLRSEQQFDLATHRIPVT